MAHFEKETQRCGDTALGGAVGHRHPEGDLVLVRGVGPAHAQEPTTHPGSLASGHMARAESAVLLPQNSHRKSSRHPLQGSVRRSKPAGDS